MKNQIIRIAIIGPESSGKSELCVALAKHYNTIHIPEYSRTYLPLLKSKYTALDIKNIYLHQFQSEKNAIPSVNKIIFTDTEFIIAKVWCEYVFGFCPEEFENNISRFPYDLYLLTSPDLPWVSDPLRENPGKGAFFFKWYKTILEERALTFRIIKGVRELRLQNAIQAIDEFMNE